MDWIPAISENLPTKSAEEEIWAMLLELQLKCGPPPPISPYDERLYAVAKDMGFAPVIGNFFGLDVKNNVLLIDTGAPPIQRVLSMAHELGHAHRLRTGATTPEQVEQRNRNFAERSMRLLVLREEVLAWREGMRILRRVGCRFNRTSWARAFRRGCLDSYRMAANRLTPPLRRLQFR